ncbi:MarR family winged helix-turn-helix transcriptional regulator [Amycolatopsis sp. H20-H5]|uniref:MarR family winged helix-turn-helix transcriptional regulator n=1 Tax=Amycolatopsis sp. H20-H5 TaxID=3046309 RepID=UPI002DB57015|nr:MarR family transcriptional regulator [Amycolatopsis sp. H20-H5]MEC3981018.1 MarR family transcriptional regulator [Amycolatopsis sp. H20-H5]
MLEVEVKRMNEFELSEHLLTCVTRIRRVLDERLKEHGLSVARKRMLGALTEGPVRQAALASAFEVAPRTVTELVDGLERDGFVERRGDPQDRRVRLVCITPAGRRANERAMIARAEVIPQMFADLSEEDRAALLRMLVAVDKRVASMSAAGLGAGDRSAVIPLDAPFIAGDVQR